MKTAAEELASFSRVRLDKWLWAARFFKTRSLATEAIEKQRVRVNGAPAKPSREVRPGDELHLLIAMVERTVIVTAVSSVRGGAPQAALLYTETETSIAQRLAAARQRELAPEPAHTLTEGRPTKRDRRDLDALRHGSGWDDRWSATLKKPQ